MAMNELADRPLRVADEAILLHWWRMARWFMNLRAVPRLRERSARYLTRVYRRCFHDTFTRTGKIILLGSLLIFLFSYQSNSDFLLASAAVGMALLAWSALLGYVHRPQVSVQRDTPAYANAGQACVSRINVTNQGPRTLHNFTLREMVVPFGRWPQEWLRPHQLALASHHSTSVEVEFEPQRRGVLELSGLAVQSYFPFFLTRFTQRIDSPCKVNVLPATLPVNVPSLRRIADLASKRMTLGTDSARKGPSLEYAYSRHYQTGDSLRRMDHRASSRQGKPMSKVFEGADEIRRDQVHLIVDLTLQDFERWQRRPRDESALDERLALAVEIGLSAQNEGFSLAAMAMGRQWHKLDNILQFYEHIALARPERACSSAGGAVGSAVGSATTSPLPDKPLAENGIHILVVGRWTNATQALVERWQREGILVLVFLIAESPSNSGTLPVGSQYIEIPRTRKTVKPALAAKTKPQEVLT